MYYLIFSDRNIRNRHNENLSQISTRNKFDLKYMRKMFGKRYKLHSEKNKISYSYEDVFKFLGAVTTVHGYSFYKCPYILELEDRDAIMAILAQDKLAKNKKYYDIRYHGHIGPFTEDDKESVLSCIKQIDIFGYMFRFFIRTISEDSLKRKDILSPDNANEANLFSELPESLAKDIKFMNDEFIEINDLCIKTHERYGPNRKKFSETIHMLEKASCDIIRKRIPANLKKG